MTDVRSIREQLGLTQGQLADQLGVSQPTISRLEAGGVVDRRTALAMDALLNAHRRERGDVAANAAAQQGPSQGNTDAISTSVAGGAA